MNTPTPRTDAAGDSLVKVYQISQKLERELTIALAEIDRLDVAGIHSCHSKCQKTNCVLRRELTAVTEQRDEARADAEKAKAYKKVFKTTNANLKRERDEAVNNYETAQLLSVRVGEQRDRLAEALLELRNDKLSHEEGGKEQQ